MNAALAPPRNEPLRLNSFQRLMLGWDELHPYNSLAVVEVRRAVTVEEVRRAAEMERLLHGLGPAQIDAARGVCVFLPDAGSVEVDTVEPLPGEDARQTLQRHTAAELNRRFVLGKDVPFRLAVIACRPYPFVSFTYHHWLCDGLTSGYLFRRILAHLLGVPLDHEPVWSFDNVADERMLFAHRGDWRRSAAIAWEILREGLNGSAICQPRRPGPFDATVAVRLLNTPPDLLDRLRATVRNTGGTVNDVLMAVVAGAVDRALPERLRNRWARTLTLGNITNMRPLAGNALHQHAGLYLGFFLIHCRAKLPRNLVERVRLIRRQSARIKNANLHVGSLTGIRLAARVWPWVPRRYRAALARTPLRVTVGLSNLRYPLDWYGPQWNDLLGPFWRVVPTGQNTPLSFGITTVGATMQLQMTALRSGYDAEQLQTIQRLVEVGLAELPG